MANSTNNQNNQYPIGTGSQYVATLQDMLRCNIGDSIFIRSIDIKDEILSRNPTKTRYWIHTDTLVSDEYDVMPIGNINGSPKIGERVVLSDNKNSTVDFLDDKGGLNGFTQIENDSEPEKRIYGPGKFRNEILDNEIFNNGGSFVGTSEFREYSTNATKDSVEKDREYYAKESIDSQPGVPTEELYKAQLMGKTNYDLENLSGPNNLSKNADSIIYEHYDEKTKGSKENSFNVLSDLDDYSFNKRVTVGPSTLVSRTNALFRNGKIGSLISRFKTDSDFNANEWPTAKTGYGMSRGRNLLTKDAFEKNKANKYNGYEDPYCRVWTAHHQYSKITNLIRPFTDDEGNLSSFSDLHAKYANFRPEESYKRLDDYSVLQNNGFVRIAPKNSDDDNDGLAAQNGKGDPKIQKYMFSIENLAWEKQDLEGYDIFHDKSDTDEDGNSVASEENTSQKPHFGPNGGRIMWFPPYGLTFSENVQVDWNPSEFIGRGEKIYSYKNTERTGTLEFIILVDHPSVVDMFTDQSKYNGKTSYENEQTLLRFFAGCESDILTDECFDEKKKIITTSGETHEIKPVNDNLTLKVCIPVFFPNNLSLVDIDDKKSGFSYLYNTYENEPPFVNPGGTLGEYNPDNFAYNSRNSCPIVHTFKEEGYRANTRTEAYMQDYAYQNEKEKQNLVNYYNGKKHWQSYYDNTSYGLNTNIFKQYLTGKLTIDDIINEYGITDETAKEGIKIAYESGKKFIKAETNEDYHYFTLEDLFSNGDFSKKKLFELISEEVKASTSDKSDETTILLNHPTSWNVTGIEYYGGASSHGYEGKNKDLNSNRANSLSSLLIKFGLYGENDVNKPDNPVTAINPVSEGSDGEFSPYGKASMPSAKAGRCAYVVINYQMDEAEADFILSTEAIKGGDIKVINSDKKSRVSASTITTQEKTIVRKLKCNEKYNFIDEYQFFKNIEKDDKILYKELTKKLSYFNPAFHSITPEGFNARLTFLHQCTRQGPTYAFSTTSDADITNNDKYIGPGNLAFGKPPYCILRIGDFYNTKIIIDSMSISYDNEGVKWDLNPEGIGVQPMMARVSLGIKFLGGSDLTGPISRLQNAVSANFYANTSIYDPISITKEKEDAEKDSTNDTYKKKADIRNKLLDKKG